MSEGFFKEDLTIRITSADSTKIENDRTKRTRKNLAYKIVSPGWIKRMDKNIYVPSAESLSRN